MVNNLYAMQEEANCVLQNLEQDHPASDGLSEETDEAIRIPTAYEDLYFPAKWKDVLQTSESAGQIDTVTFVILDLPPVSEVSDAMAGKKKYHRYFDNLLLMLNRESPEACGMGGRCGMQYVVEADGSIYPCDFYMLDPYRLGNLNEVDFAALDQQRKALGFIEESTHPDPECLSCPWKYLCRGGCRRDRDYFDRGLGKNYYCEAYREFFPYAYPRLQQLYLLLTGHP